jgi:CDP-glucose 4,6-dehydratase
MGIDLAPTVLSEARSEIIEQSLDATRARTELGWRAELGLEQGLDRTIAWYREFFARSGSKATG